MPIINSFVNDTEQKILRLQNYTLKVYMYLRNIFAPALKKPSLK